VLPRANLPRRISEANSPEQWIRRELPPVEPHHCHFLCNFFLQLQISSVLRNPSSRSADQNRASPPAQWGNFLTPLRAMSPARRDPGNNSMSASMGADVNRKKCAQLYTRHKSFHIRQFRPTKGKAHFCPPGCGADLPAPADDLGKGFCAASGVFLGTPALSGPFAVAECNGLGCDVFCCCRPFLLIEASGR